MRKPTALLNALLGLSILITVSFSADAATGSATGKPVFLPDNSPSALARRCAPEVDGSPAIRVEDFHWGYDLPALISRFAEMYASNKRLARRNYWNAEKNTLELPYEAMRGGAAALPVSFVDSVRRHIEQALQGGYIDGVFFPDMGHSHFLIPNEIWSEYDAIPIAKMKDLYEKFFVDPRVKVLYHTAEQLKTRNDDGSLVDDARTRWRYSTRNIVGTNNGEGPLEVLGNPDSAANTVNDVAGYRWWGAGFNVSANQNGCLEYATPAGEIRRFDISLYDLESEDSGLDP